MAGSLGLQGAYASGSLQALLRQRMQDQIDAELRARQAMESDRRFGLDQQAHASTEQLKRATLDATIANRDAQRGDQQFRMDQGLAEQIPANAELPGTSPVLGQLQRIGMVAAKGIQEQPPPASIAANPDETPTDLPGTVANSPLTPTNPGRIYRKLPTSKQITDQQTAQDREANNASLAANRDELAGIRQQVADIARQKADQGPKAPTPHFGFMQTYDADGKPSGVIRTDSTGGGISPVALPGGASGLKPPPAAKQLPYQAAENAAGLNTAEVEGVKVLKGLKAAGLDQSNDPADPRWAKFVVTTLKMAPADYNKADIQQRTAFIDAALTRQLMGGRPSQYVAQIIQQHLPKGEMTGQQLTHVLHNVLQQTNERRKEIQQMMPGVKGPISGQSYEDYLTGLANGPAADGLPTVGSTFQGGKVLKVEKVP